MNKRFFVVLLVVIIFAAAVWMIRRPARSVVNAQPGTPVIALPPITSSVEPTATKSIGPDPLTIPKSSVPRVKRQAMTPATHVDHPTPAGLPTAIPVAPVIPAPVWQPHPTLPVVPVAPIPEEQVQEWKGNSDSSIQHKGQIVVQTDPQWVHFWAEHRPGEAAPDVDFTRFMVVGVFLGLRPSDGFQVEIKHVRTLADKVVVDYIQLDPPPGTFQIGVSAYPYDIKVIPRSALRVTFNQLTAQYQRAAPVVPTQNK